MTLPATKRRARFVPAQKSSCFDLFVLVGIAWVANPLSAAAGSGDQPPEYEVIPAAKPEELTPANGWPDMESFRTWTRSHGGPASIRYSALDQINRTNVGRLRVAWVHRSGDGPGNVQCNPIVVGRMLFAPTSGKHIVALDGATGKERWRFRPESGSALQDIPARRGLVYWPGKDRIGARILLAAGNWIYALDPVTGKPIPSFGREGRTEIPTAGSAGGVVWRDLLIIPGYLGDVYAYDAASGKQRWRFHTVPRPGEFGANTWATPEKGANCWGGIALDEPRGIVYVSTGSPKPNFVGVNRAGDNLFGNCVLALDAASGRRRWHFQEVRHDIWNYDLPAPPNLVTVTRGGRKVDAVAQVTKLGHTLLLDRVTGKPLFPFRLRRAPPSTIPGEQTAAYQPDPELPERFIDHFFTFRAEDITDRTPEARDYVTKLIAGADYGTWFAPMQLNKPTVTYGDNGGANWPGASFDPTTGRLYVTANELPWIMSILRDDDPPPLVPATAGDTAYQQFCATCHGPARRGLGMVPGLLGLRHRMGGAELIAILRSGRGAMPAVPQLPAESIPPLVDFLLARDRPPLPAPSDGRARYIHAGFRRLTDHEGYPGIKPPWGTLNCLDLNTGKLVWKVPVGEHPELKRAGASKTGTENYGGATTTAGGLVFCGGTRDAKLRAFDAATGDELWAGDLPHDGSTPPTTYLVDGRQYVVIAAVGVRMLRGPEGDAWVAFALEADAPANEPVASHQRPSAVLAVAPAEGARVERNVPARTRDGVILRADVYRPTGDGPHPVLVLRTPYGKHGGRPVGPYVHAGYMVVKQDARGRYASDGTYESLYRFGAHDAGDGYDTVEWAARLPGANGRVGTFGISYDAFLQWRLAALRPPSLVAMAASSIPPRLTDLEGPGTIRPGRRLDWYYCGMTPEMRRRSGAPGPATKEEARAVWSLGMEERLLFFLPWRELPRYVFEDDTDDVQAWLRVPHVDPWNLLAACGEIAVPNINFVGWFDHCNDSIELFQAMRREGRTAAARAGQRLVIGPWSHATLGRRKQGDIDFGPDAEVKLEDMQVRWFDRWMKPRPAGAEAEPPVRLFVMGANRWRDEDEWPLSRAQALTLFLGSSGHANTPRGDGRMTRNLPPPAADRYVYDPRIPVPTLWTATKFTVPADQRPLADRDDILVYQTEPLTEPWEVTGYPEVVLYMAASTPDADVFARLIDVAPDGSARDVAMGMVRARYRQGLAKPALLVPGDVTEFRIRLRPTANEFQPGHRIRLDVTSSDFPNYDRNHNTAADQNGDARLVPVEIALHHGGPRPSRLILPVIPRPRPAEVTRVDPARDRP